MRRILALALLAGVLVAIAPGGAAAGSRAQASATRSCSHFVDFNLKIISARNMRCRTARGVMRRFRGSIAPSFDAPDGFHCRLKQGRLISGIWRCTRGDKAFRFTFGD